MFPSAGDFVPCPASAAAPKLGLQAVKRIARAVAMWPMSHIPGSVQDGLREL